MSNANIRVTFTGTRRGMTLKQIKQIEEWFANTHNILEAHHGGCEGADRDFHDMLLYYIPIHRIHIHPGRVEQLEWACQQQRQRKEIHIYAIPLGKKPELARNRIMVSQSNVVLATPAQEQEVLRSGTWATIREARKRKTAGLCSLTIFLPY